MCTRACDKNDVARLDDLLAHMLKANAQSLRFQQDSPPILLIGREHVPLSNHNVTAAMITALLDSLLDEGGRRALSVTGQHDGSYDATATLGHSFNYRVRQSPDGIGLAFKLADGDRPYQSTPASLVPLGGSMGTPTAVAVEVAPPRPPVRAGGDEWRTDDIRELLKQVVGRRCSDLVVSSGKEARVRIAGDYKNVPGGVFDDAAILRSLGDTLTPERRQVLDLEGSLDTALEIEDGPARLRFRVNVFSQMHGLAAAFRPIWDTVPSLEALNLPRELLPLVEFPYGLVLVTGPTGSGKSTTLSALLERLNATAERHVITLEDPIEYVFRNERCLIHQREIGVHVRDFAYGLRSALREAPDVIFVGEMRDLDTIAAALTAAETGHLVLSTLHSGSAAQAVDRIIDVFPEHQQSQVRIQLADTLRAIVTQRLLPTVDGRGRIPAIELIRINYAFSNLIRERRTHLFTSTAQSNRKDGTVPFDESLSRLVRDGHIKLEVAERAARDPKHLKLLIAALESGGG